MFGRFRACLDWECTYPDRDFLSALPFPLEASALSTTRTHVFLDFPRVYQ